MKNIKPLILSLAIMLIGITNTNAQQIAKVENLTQEQLKLKNEVETLKKKNREAYKALLTPSQKAILKDETLEKKERRKKVRESFSESQKETLKKNREALKKAKDAFKNTLTGEGKVEKERKGHKKHEARSKGKRFHNITGLTSKQKAILDESKKKMEINKKAFRSTFSEAQKKIVTDQSLSRKEKREALNKTLTDEQKKQLENNKQEYKLKMEKFKATLTPEQKKQMRPHKKGNK